MVKRILLSLTLLAMLATIVGPHIPASANTPIRVTVNGRVLTTDAPPVIQSGRTLVPFRAIFEAMGASVHWDAAKRTVSAYAQHRAIVLEIGNTTVWVNGPEQKTDVAPQIIDGRTMVPLRLVAEAMGAIVNWDAVTSTVSVNFTPYEPKPIGGTYFIGAIGDPINLIGILSADTASTEVNGRTNWGLVRFSEKNEPMNAIADRWSYNATTMTWRFWLNPNAKWHDGVPVTARDVKMTLDAVSHPDYTGPRRSNMVQTQEIIIIDSHTVDFKMKTTFAPFLFNVGLGLSPFHVLGNVPVKDWPTHAYNRNATPGNGPYKLDRWVSGQWVKLDRSTNFFQGSRPYIQNVIIRNYPDMNVMEAAFQNGDIDAHTLNPDNVVRIRAAMANRAHFYEVPNHGYVYAGFNLENPKLADRNVREALVTAIDRNAIIKNILDGRGTIIHAHQIPTTWATGAPNLNTYAFNPTRARQLLDAAGWVLLPGKTVREKAGVPLRIELGWNAGNTIRQQIAEMTASFWKAVGVDGYAASYEWSVYLDRWSSGLLDLTIIGWSLGLDPDPYPMFHSSAAVKGADGKRMGFNRMPFINARVDELLEKARATVVIAERRAYYHEVDQILNRELPYIWFYQALNTVGYANKVQGLYWAPTGAIWSEAWYIK